jgi:hypothetical protein
MQNPVRTDINIRSPRYLLAHTLGTCWHCRASTQLFALVVPPGHEALELDDEAQDAAGDEAQNETQNEALAVDIWCAATHHAFLFYIEFLPAVIQDRLKQFTQSYRLEFSDAAHGPYWANHCERCGSLLDDHELFCEPEGAFLPTSESSAGAIHLLALDEAFEAAAGGYAHEPQFFNAMSRT